MAKLGESRILMVSLNLVSAIQTRQRPESLAAGFGAGGARNCSLGRSITAKVWEKDMSPGEGSKISNIPI
jgi:hypothetical protein